MEMRRKNKEVFWKALLVLAVSFGHAARSQQHSSLRKLQHSPSSLSDDESSIILLCRVRKETILRRNQFGSWGEDIFLCSLWNDDDGQESDESYEIPSLPNSLLEAYTHEMEHGSLVIGVPGARIAGSKLSGYNANDIFVSENIPYSNRRMLQAAREPVIGTRTILVLRVSVDDQSVGHTADLLSERIFGNGISMKMQYAKCSAGKLWFQPAAVRTNGILEVPLNATNLDDSTFATSISNAAISRARQLLGLSEKDHISSQADHIMIFLPPGTGNWVASAAVDHWRSTYNDRYCGSLSASMHEIGHNLGLLHANENGDYLDYTSYMSAGSAREFYPQKCFNGQNHWHLGWFNENTLSLYNITEPVTVKLRSFIDYRTLQADSDEPVLISIDDEFFLQYNEASSFNFETQEKADQVTIVQLLDGGTEMLAGIDEVERLYFLNDEYGNMQMIVLVCWKEIDSIGTTIGLSIGKDTVQCTDDPTGIVSTDIAPSASPAISSSSAPSFFDTVESNTTNSVVNMTTEESKQENLNSTEGTDELRVATSSPSDSESSSPSNMVISDYPSMVPSLNPSYWPSSPQSSQDDRAQNSLAPSSNPSWGPSNPPSVAPSQQPSIMYSLDPTPSPTLGASEDPTETFSDAPSDFQSKSFSPSMQPGEDSYAPTLLTSTPSNVPTLINLIKRPDTTNEDVAQRLQPKQDGSSVVPSGEDGVRGSNGLRPLQDNYLKTADTTQETQDLSIRMETTSFQQSSLDGKSDSFIENTGEANIFRKRIEGRPGQS
jgi:hypothetical protein